MAGCHCKIDVPGFGSFKNITGRKISATRINKVNWSYAILCKDGLHKEGKMGEGCPTHSIY